MAASSNKLETSDDATVCCDLCLSCEKDKFSFGEFYVRDSVSCHYFCLLSATNLLQKGEDEDGILGFEIDDIKNHCKTVRRNKCHYCDMQSATIKCAHKGCAMRFHYICGSQNNCVTEFFGNFPSYCPEHHKLQTADVKDQHPPDYPCGICFDDMGDYNVITSFTPNCCITRDNWYHKKCIMRGTAEAGYYTSCIFCADDVDYIPQIQKFGIFLPQQDATWESKGAYAELTKQSCKMTDCKRPNSLRHTIMVCVACGCFPAHKACLKLIDNDYLCKSCFDQTFVNLLK